MNENRGHGFEYCVVQLNLSSIPGKIRFCWKDWNAPLYPYLFSSILVPSHKVSLFATKIDYSHNSNIRTSGWGKLLKSVKKIGQIGRLASDGAEVWFNLIFQKVSSLNADLSLISLAFSIISISLLIPIVCPCIISAGDKCRCFISSAPKQNLVHTAFQIQWLINLTLRKEKRSSNRFANKTLNQWTN